MGYYSLCDESRDKVKENTRESINLLQDIIFRRCDNNEYTEEYYKKIRESLALLNQVYEELF